MEETAKTCDGIIWKQKTGMGQQHPVFLRLIHQEAVGVAQGL